MAQKNTKIMALDIGAARTGVAMTDELLITAQPVTTIEHKTLKELFSGIKSLIMGNNVGKIIIGYPKELDGREGEKAGQIAKLSRKLHAFLQAQRLSSPSSGDIEIILWDERLTTCQAEKIVIGTKLKNKAKSAALDRVSAAIILESYLNSTKNAK